MSRKLDQILRVSVAVLYIAFIALGVRTCSRCVFAMTETRGRYVR